MEVVPTSRKKGIAGIVVALILFAMLFVVGGSYFLFVGKSNIALDQASGSAFDAFQQQRAENLAVKVALDTTSSNLVASLTNIGGVPTSISYIYLTDVNGKTILPPPAATNITASHWPLTLNVGASSYPNSGCISGQNGCNIKVTSCVYGTTCTGTVYVNVVTSRGNIFSGVFPPNLGSGVSSSSLVVQMVAFPTPPLTQVFSCKACISLNITVDNFASSLVSGIFLSPNPPTIIKSGTVTVTFGATDQCKNDNSTTTIKAYSGTGKPPYIRFTCTFDSQTGNVGGYVSFSGIAEGTLNTVVVSSAEAISNSLQIGANANAITQGAFSINFFFFKASSCTQSGVGNWHSPCTTNINPSAFPPSSPNKLPQSATLSVGSDYYVTFYVNITNNYPTSLEILQYSFLQFDSSYFDSANPTVLGNEPDFWLAGTANAYNTAEVYYPTYCNNPNPPTSCTNPPRPTLAAYTGNLDPKNPANCIETGPLWNPSTNCIDIKTGQTLTLAFAACGFGSTGWEWGGSQYAKNFDAGSSLCDSSTPAWASNGVASVLTVVISYVIQGQIYTQAIQFQGQALTP